MFLSWRYLGAAALALCALTACGSADESLPPSGQGGANGVDASISFDSSVTLKLAPGELVDVIVRGTPAAAYEISFFLVGNSQNASLDRNKVIADANGVAMVTLQAPNAATNFVLRASIKGGPSADLAVAVSEKGFGNLLIEPKYSGPREVGEWVASVVSGQCDKVVETLPKDPAGALKVEATAGEALLIEDAPVGPNLAVVVRARGYAWGCVDENGLQAGGTIDVAVPIANRPIDFSQTDLSVDLAFAPQEPDWGLLLDNEMEGLSAQFFGNGSGSVDGLLNAMSAASNNPADFQSASATNNWQASMTHHLDVNAIDISASLINLAQTALAQEPETVAAHLGPTEGDGYALLTFASIGSVNADTLGVPLQLPLTVNADPDDTVRLGTTMPLHMSRYLGTLIEQQGLAQRPNLQTFPQVLSEIAQCGSLDLSGWQGCDSDCITQLCEDALATMWLLALDASLNDYGFAQVPLEISGAAQLDDDANLVGFDGTWLGNVVAGQLSAKVTGAASGMPVPSAPESVD